MIEHKTFTEKLKAKWDQEKFMCVGLDSSIDKLPHVIFDSKAYSNMHPVLAFNKAIINSTKDLVAAYKINTAFYEHKSWGPQVIEDTVEYIRSVDPKIPIIGDMKRGDTEDTNKDIAKIAYERYNFDAVTVNPYMGLDFEPFLKYSGKGIFALCKTTDKKSKDFQDLNVALTPSVWDLSLEGEDARKIEELTQNPFPPLYQVVAYLVAERYPNEPVGLVVGAIYKYAFEKVRLIAPNLPLLIPGIGTQGGNLENVLKYAPDSNNQGMVISSSRGIIYASEGNGFHRDARKSLLISHEFTLNFRKHGKS